MMSLKLRHNYFLKFNFVTISLKKHNFAKYEKLQVTKTLLGKGEKLKSTI